jgi:futalosine hydrolase
MKFFAILSSMSFESDKIIAGLKNVRTIKIAGKTVYRGRLSGHHMLFLNTGIGKVNAAHSATCLMENYSIKGLINIGVGGAYPASGLKTGDIAIASKEIYGDEGVITSKGWAGMTEIGIPVVQIAGKKYFNEFILNSALSRKLITRHLSPVTKIKSGPFVTVSSTTGTHKRAAELQKRFHAVCENMEGAAIAQVCAIYDIPMLEIRGISNIVGERDRRKWNLDIAAENCQDLVLKMFLIENRK